MMTTPSLVVGKLTAPSDESANECLMVSNLSVGTIHPLARTASQPGYSALVLDFFAGFAFVSAAPAGVKRMVSAYQREVGDSVPLL